MLDTHNAISVTSHRQIWIKKQKSLTSVLTFKCRSTFKLHIAPSNNILESEWNPNKINLREYGIKP